MRRIEFEVVGCRKYRLGEDTLFATKIVPPKMIVTERLILDKLGVLEVLEGFVWNGPSGPALDTANFMRASCAHDALYQLILIGLLPYKYKRQADLLLKEVCLEDYMSRHRATYVYWCVRIFGGIHLTVALVKNFLTSKTR